MKVFDLHWNGLNKGNVKKIYINIIFLTQYLNPYYIPKFTKEPIKTNYAKSQLQIRNLTYQFKDTRLLIALKAKTVSEIPHDFYFWLCFITFTEIKAIYT